MTLLFNSLQFIFVFFPIVSIIFWLLRSKKQRYWWLALAGYVFYGLWDYRFAPLLFATTVFNFLAAKLIFRNKEIESKENAEKNAESKARKNKKIILVVAIIVNLGLLGFFKYFNFASSMLNQLATIFNLSLNSPILSLILPLGISFYTFQSISYILDVSSGKIKPAASLLEFICYMSLFPQLVSGPIVRYSEISQSLDNIDKVDNSRFVKGVNLFVFGLAKKIMLADTIAMFINPMLSGYSSLTTFTAWAAVLGYSFQLYFDFSGYTDMALGLACFFGFDLPINFNSPFKALNLSDFWRRWHMSLTRWVNDYLFLPLTTSGKKGISKAKILGATIITMFLLGLWHGAGLTFLAFGLYHGILIVMYHLTKKWYDLLPKLIRRIITFVLIVIGFLIFRSDSFSMLLAILGKMFAFTGGLPFFEIRIVILLLLIAASAFISFFLKNTNQLNYLPKKQYIIYAIILALLLVISIVALGRAEVAFLYYQF